MKRLWAVLALGLALLAPDLAKADFNFTSTGSATGFSFTCFTTKNCFASVIINSSGAELFTNTNAAYVQFPASQTVNANQAGAWTVTAVQPTAANLNVAATQSGTWNVSATFPAPQSVNATQSGVWSVTAVQATASNLLMTAVQPTAANLNMSATQAGTWTTTVTQATAANLNVTAVQSGTWTVSATFPSAQAVTAAQSGTWSVTAVQPTGTNLHMVCDSGCVGAGGTSSTFGVAFPTVGTAIGLTTGSNMVPWSATTNYGTAPAAILVPAVNAFVTNTNNNGLANMTLSSPVVIASDQKVSTQNASVPINVSTITTTQLVALSGTTKIYVTAYDVIAGGTGNITFEYGTGTNCATGTTALTGAYPLAAQDGISKGSGIAPVLVVPAGNALCVLTSAAVQMSGSLTYQQF